MTVSAEPSELRCYCASHHLLALVERDSTGNVRLHVQSIKRGEAVVDLIALVGKLKIRCRACKRWHTISIRRDKIDSDDPNLIPVFKVDG